jgi:hypothetical protein
MIYDILVFLAGLAVGGWLVAFRIVYKLNKQKRRLDK